MSLTVEGGGDNDGLGDWAMFVVSVVDCGRRCGFR